MSKPDTPAQPDYKGAAQATGESSLANTELQARLNRNNVISPLGTQTWTQGAPTTDQAGYDQAMAAYNNANPKARLGMTQPDLKQFQQAGNYTQNISLTPEQQKIFDTGQTGQQQMADLSNREIGSASSTLANPFDASKVEGGQKQIQDAMYARQTGYLDPQFAQREESERDRLANQGFQVGNEGYDRAMGNFNRDRTFAYGEARDRSIQAGQEAQKQAVQEALMTRNQPLNEINALRTGSQVQMPQFQATAPVGSAQPTDYAGAAGQTGLFNIGSASQQAAQYNAQMQAAALAASYGLYGMMGKGGTVAAAGAV